MKYALDIEGQGKKRRGSTRQRRYCNFCHMILCRPGSDYCSEACRQADANRCECGEISIKGSVFCKTCRDRVIKRNEEVTHIHSYIRLIKIHKKIACKS